MATESQPTDSTTPSKNIKEEINPLLSSVHHLVSDRVADEDISNVTKLWYYIKNCKKIDDEQDWPFEAIIIHQPLIVPNTHPDVPAIPIQICEFLMLDLRPMTVDQRLDHASNCLLPREINKFDAYWLNVLLNILQNFTNCKVSRTRSEFSKRKTILENIYEDTETEKNNTGRIDEESRSTSRDELIKNRTESSPKYDSSIDLNKSIQVMMQVFPASDRLSGSETEPFIARLTPILEQMNASKIPFHHQPTVLFSLTQAGSKARKSLRSCNLTDLDIDEAVKLLKNTCLYDSNIQDRRASRWRNITYNQFRSRYDTEDEATRECIDHVTTYHKDLPVHLNNDAQLRDRLKEIFKPVSWCSTLFERSIAQYSPSQFASQVITAAANADERKKLSSDIGSTNPIFHSSTNSESGYAHTFPPEKVKNLVAFFAKTPPPRRNARPPRFQGTRNFYPYRRSNQRNYNSRFPRQIFSSASRNRRCYGCNNFGHMIRNCPQKQKYLDKLTHLVHVGEAAKLISESVDSNDNTSETQELVGFLEEAEEIARNQDDEFPDFHAWICELLEHVDELETSDQNRTMIHNGYYVASHLPDSHHVDIRSTHEDSFFLNISIPELQQLCQEITHVVAHMSQISRFMLIDTGAPKSICSEDWLTKANWKPIEIRKLPPGTKPFRFAGHPVQPKYLACMICKLKDNDGKENFLRQVVFVLPTIPIPFLTGLQVQRSLGFDICLRREAGSHIRVQNWNTTVPLHISSHLWLEFKPVNEDPEPEFNWSNIIEETIKGCGEINHAYFPVHDIDNQAQQMHNPSEVYPVPPWQRDDWTSALNPNDIDKLHKTLRHPEPTALLQLFRQQRENRRLPTALKNRIVKKKCPDCEENAQLPRVPKISLPPPATPNLAVTLDVMQHDINEKPIKILVMLDAGDMMLRLKKLDNESAQTAFSAYFSRWISIFDSPVFTIVDRGRNLTNKLMGDELRAVHSQLCPIPTEAPWSIGNNERSHAFLHRILNKLISAAASETQIDIDIILSEAEMSWNFTQHRGNTIPHYNRFGVMPRELGQTESTPNIRTRIACMEIAREHTEKVRAEFTILRALNRKYRHVTEMKLFQVNDKVWFHRSKHGWRIGNVTKVERPTIHIHHNNKTYPAHENRIRPYFGENSLPPELTLDDPETCSNLDKPPERDPSDINNDQTSSEHSPDRNRKPTAISDLINASFFVQNPIEPSKDNQIITDDNLIFLNTGPSKLEVIDSSVIYHTEVQRITKLDHLNENEKTAFEESMREEIEFLLKNTVKPIQESERNRDCEIQPLKWILNIKRSPNSKNPIRYRARLGSASHQTELRHYVHGNTPTVSLHTIRIAMSLFPTWFKEGERKGKKIFFFTRDVTKAFLQSIPSKRLVYYQPPPQFYKHHPTEKGKIWKGITQLYGDVEAGLYWNRTFVPWLCGNIANLKQSIYDPSLLYNNARPAVMMLCTDDTANILDITGLKEEATITNRFVCTSREFSPVEFKGIDIIQRNEFVALSQVSYAEKMELKNLPLDNYTKPEQTRQLDGREMSLLRSDSGRLAWLATGTSPLSSFHASVSLQSGKDNPRTVKTMIDARNALRYIQKNLLSTLTFKPLDNQSIHIRMYTDGAFQNLSTKHSQIGFVIMLSDKNNVSNIVHWHSARANRRPNSTEESEMFALDAGIKCIRNMRKIIYQLLDRDVPIVCFIDNQSLWMNLMNITAHSIP